MEYTATTQLVTPLSPLHPATTQSTHTAWSIWGLPLLLVLLGFLLFGTVQLAAFVLPSSRLWKKMTAVLSRQPVGDEETAFTELQKNKMSLETRMKEYKRMSIQSGGDGCGGSASQYSSTYTSGAQTPTPLIDNFALQRHNMGTIAERHVSHVKDRPQFTDRVRWRNGEDNLAFGRDFPPMDRPMGHHSPPSSRSSRPVARVSPLPTSAILDEQTTQFTEEPYKTVVEIHDLPELYNDVPGKYYEVSGPYHGARQKRPTPSTAANIKNHLPLSSRDPLFDDSDVSYRSRQFPDAYIQDIYTNTGKQSTHLLQSSMEEYDQMLNNSSADGGLDVYRHSKHKAAGDVNDAYISSVNNLYDGQAAAMV